MQDINIEHANLIIELGRVAGRIKTTDKPDNAEDINTQETPESISFAAGSYTLADVTRNPQATLRHGVASREELFFTFKRAAEGHAGEEIAKKLTYEQIEEALRGLTNAGDKTPIQLWNLQQVELAEVLGRIAREKAVKGGIGTGIISKAQNGDVSPDEIASLFPDPRPQAA